MAPQADPEELIAENNWLRITLNSIGDAVIATDQAGCIVAMNPVAEALTGWEEAQAHDKPLTEVFNIVHAQTAEPVPDPVQRVLDTGKIVGLGNHTKLIAKDGAEYQISDSAAPIKDADGQTQGVVLVFRDVTQEYALREALRESEARFRVAQELSPDGFTILHPVRNDTGEVVDFTWVYENQTIALINGTDPKAVIGKRLLDILPNHRETPVFEAYRQVAETGKNRVMEDVTVGEILGKPTWLRLVVVSMGKDIAVLAQDITERKALEKSLSESEEKFRTLVDQAPIALFLHDMTGQIVEINRRTLENYGYTEDEIIGLKASDIDVDFIEREDEGAFWDQLNHQGQMDFQAQHKRKDDSFFPVSISLSAIELQGQKFILALAEDITERVQAECALRASEEKFRALFETMSEGVVYQNAEGKITSANPAAERLLGLSLEQMQGKTSLDPRWKAVDQHGQDLPGEQHAAMIALRTGEKVENYLQGIYIPERDAYVWIIVNAVPQFKAGSDSPYQVYATFVDITERFQAEEALRASEEKYRSLFNQSTEGIYLHDLAGRILDVNEMACEQSGYAKEELLGLTVFDLHPAESQLNLPKEEALQIWGKWAPGQRHRVEAEHQRKDGSVFPVEISTGVVHYQDEQALLAIVKDVTERAQREARIKHLNQVLRAVRDVNQLITQEKDREALLWRACDILTTTRGYGNAWVALRGDDGRVEIAAECGIDEGFKLLRQAMARGDWPECCQQAFAHPESVAVIHAPNRNCKTCSLSDLHRDTAAMAGALHYGEQDFGVLVVALPKALAGDKEEQALFRELVDDLAYALHAIALEEERKAAEGALRASEDRFRRAVNEAPFPAMIHAEDGEVMLINTRWTQVTGYPQEEIPTLEAWTEKAYGERQGPIREVIDALYEAPGHTDEGDFEVRCRDGSTRIWSFRSTPLGTDDRGRRLVLSMAVDITERKRAEDDLRQLKDHLEDEVAQKTQELQERVDILERFHAATIKRELRMKELRDEIARLKGETG